jgi:hypothetical protein
MPANPTGDGNPDRTRPRTASFLALAPSSRSPAVVTIAIWPPWVARLHTQCLRIAVAVSPQSSGGCGAFAERRSPVAAGFSPERSTRNWYGRRRRWRGDLAGPGLSSRRALASDCRQICAHEGRASESPLLVGVCLLDGCAMFLGHGSPVDRAERVAVRPSTV